MNFFGPYHSYLFIYLFIYTFIPFFNLFIMYCSYKDIDSLYLSGGFFFIFSFLPIFLHCVNCIFFFFFLFWVKISPLGNNNKKVEQIPVQRIFIFLKNKWHNFFAIFLSFLKKLNLADLDRSFYNIAKYSGIPKKKSTLLFRL